ncbi:hypothetical protein [Levilactobacillus bambusae]|uniref:Glycosyl transferase family 1 n=1 Tax=Levilactobacillus bambusae TaxID=2024736 RepID=A0A2V1MXB7_9LACO|nr:hypothetical protein [Levilactobacillus bambusae]PWF99658.1 hypothetical protein DCM90_07530 [Levilactobacillus bambusae]
MKKYVIFTHVIRGTEIGGSLIYTRNKVNDVKDRGHVPYVYSRMGDRDDVIVYPELLPFRDHLIYELAYAPSLFSRQRVRRILDRFLTEIDYQVGDDVIIESHDITEALWAELLAQETSGQNFVYLINEYTADTRLKSRERDFIGWKLSHRQLAVLSPVTYDYLLPGHRVPDYQRYLLKAPDSNVVADTSQPTPVDDLPLADYHVASIGRLEKPYVAEMLTAVIEFCERYKKKQVHLTLIGDTADETVKNRLIDRCAAVPNLELLITGYLLPIPRRFFRQVDVFISSAGSTLVSHHEGIPTLVMSPESQALGLMGWTTDQILFGKPSPVGITDWLDRILVGGYCHTHRPLFKISKPDFARQFDEHERFVQKMMKGHYFPARTFNADPRWKTELNWLGVRLLGPRRYGHMRENIVQHVRAAETQA